MVRVCLPDSLPVSWPASPSRWSLSALAQLPHHQGVPSLASLLTFEALCPLGLGSGAPSSKKPTYTLQALQASYPPTHPRCMPAAVSSHCLAWGRWYYGLGKVVLQPGPQPGPSCHMSLGMGLMEFFF